MRDTVLSTAMQEAQAIIEANFRPGLIQRCIIGVPHDGLSSGTPNQGFAALEWGEPTILGAGLGTQQTRAFYIMNVHFFLPYTPSVLNKSELTVGDAVQSLLLLVASNPYPFTDNCVGWWTYKQDFQVIPSFTYIEINGVKFRQGTYPVLMEVRKSA